VNSSLPPQTPSPANEAAPPPHEPTDGAVLRAAAAALPDWEWAQPDRPKKRGRPVGSATKPGGKLARIQVSFELGRLLPVTQKRIEALAGGRRSNAEVIISLVNAACTTEPAIERLTADVNAITDSAHKSQKSQARTEEMAARTMSLIASVREEREIDRRDERDERQRLAKDLSDGIQRGLAPLTAKITQLEAANAQLTRVILAMRDHQHTLIQQYDELTAEVAQLSVGLEEHGRRANERDADAAAENKRTRDGINDSHAKIITRLASLAKAHGLATPAAANPHRAGSA
jgi:chromosome segregation ATPase